MPIVKITQKGWEGYNGHLEGIKFENGQSVESLSNHAAERLGGSMRVIDIETGKVVSATQRLLDSKRLSVKPGDREATANVVVEKPVTEPVAEKIPQSLDYTRESLESIADKGGISLLREFAREYNVNGTSIVGIIDALMAKK